MADTEKVTGKICGDVYSIQIDSKTGIHIIQAQEQITITGHRYRAHQRILRAGCDRNTCIQVEACDKTTGNCAIDAEINEGTGNIRIDIIEAEAEILQQITIQVCQDIKSQRNVIRIQVELRC